MGFRGCGNPRRKRTPLRPKILVENGPPPLPRPPVSWYTMTSCKEVKDGQGGRVRTDTQSPRWKKTGWLEGAQQRNDHPKKEARTRHVGILADSSSLRLDLSRRQ